MSLNSQLKSVHKDIQYALRSWHRGGGAAIIAVGTLTLALAITTALFSVVRAVLLTPLPFKEPERIAMIWESPPSTKEHSLVLPLNFSSWKKSTKSFSEMAAIRRRRMILKQSGEPTELNAESVSSNLFQLLGVQPILGRGFLPGDDVPGKQQIVMLSEKLWHEHFGRSSGVLGETITLDNTQYSVVGVLPNLDVWLGHQPDLWIPLLLDDSPIRFLLVVGQLNHGVTVSAAQAEFNVIARDLERSRPEMDKGWKVTVVPLTEQMLGKVKVPILVLFSSCVLVLLIACANVGNISLIRLMARKKQLAIQCALGASTWRIVRQTFIEAIILSAGASLLAIPLAYGLLRVFLRVAPADIPRIHETSLNGFVLAFDIVITFLTAIAVGVLPAVSASKVDLNNSLKGRESASSSSSRLRASEWFIAVQVCLAVGLMSGATVLLNGLWRMQNQRLGFDPRSVLTMNIKIPNSQYRSESWQANFYHEIIAKVATVPTVTAAALSSALPSVEPLISETTIGVVGRPTSGQKLTSAVQIVDGDYFKTMSIAIVNGRGFNAPEFQTDHSVAIVNESFAKHMLSGQNAVGQHIMEGGGDSGPSLEIIGVAADVAPTEFAASSAPVLYVPLVHFPFPALTLVVRTSSPDPLMLGRSCIDRIHSLEPDQPVTNIGSMEQALAARISRPRFNAMLFGAFSAIALAFSLVGIYSVVSYHVAQSTRTIGIRLALGAPRPKIITTMLKRNLLPVVYGLAVGVLLAWISSSLLSSIISVRIAYPLSSVTGVFFLFLLMSSLATSVPLRHALKVDPLLVLRTE